MTDRIEKTIDLKAPVERVWSALADAHQFGQWFGVALEGDFDVGAMIGGYITLSGYSHLRFEVEVVRLDPPSRFSFRWHPFAIDPGVDYSGEPTTLVEFQLEATAAGVRLTVVETGFQALPALRREPAFRANGKG